MIADPRLAAVPFSFMTRGLAEGNGIDGDDLVWHLLWGDTDDV